MKETQVSDKAQNGHGPVRVLLVEDNPGDARLIREMLRPGDPPSLMLTHAASMKEALAHIKQASFDAILADLSLPDSEGTGTLTRLHAAAPDTAIVVLTGNADDAEGSRLVKLGAQDYLWKGILDRRQLHRSLRYARERQSILQQLKNDALERENLHASLRQLIERNVDGIFVVNEKGILRYANQAAEQLFGLQSGDLVGELFGQLAINGETGELTLRTRHGETREIEVRHVRTEWDSGEVVTVMFLHDISERKHYEAELQELNRRLEERVAERTAALHENNRLLENVFSNTHTLIAYLDPQANFIRVNRAYADASRKAPGYFPGKNHFELYPDAENEEIFRRVVATGEPFFAHAKPFSHPDQPERGVTYWDWSLTPVKDDSMVTGLVLVLLDVTERFKAEADMRKLSSAIEQSADAVIITDSGGRIEYVNPAFERISGYARGDALGQTPSLVKSGRMPAEFFTRLWSTIKAGNVFRDTFVNRRKDGSLFYEEKAITPLRNDGGEITHFISTSRDVTERMQDQERINRLVNYDILTDLPNRSLLIDRTSQVVARHPWQQRLAAVFVLDIDRLQLINDTFGNEGGDQLLRTMAERLRACVREGDTVSRLTGGTFAVLLVEVDAPENVAFIASKILRQIEEPFPMGQNTVFASASMGISLFPGDGTQANDLLRNAEAAMFKAKEIGRSQYQFYTADMNSRAHERLVLEADLRRALEQREFVLYYQPLMKLVDDAIDGVEALIRWRSPQRGLVPPDVFIPVLEETGLIVPVGEWVLQEACNQHQAWRAQGIGPLKVAVNLAARQLQHDNLRNAVDLALARSGMEARYLELEMTENIAMQQISHAMADLKVLSERGVGVCIDDFGTGYSSLSYLTRLPADTLKIDRSFVANVPGNRQDEGVVSSIIALGHSLEKCVVAEGVEKPEQVAFLRRQGCDLAQGYLYSRPVPAEEIVELLKRKTDS